MEKLFSSLFFSLPGRYASALLNTSAQSFANDFDITLRVLEQDPSSALLLNSPYLNKKQVIDFLDIISVKLELQKEFSNFLKLLVQKNRLNILSDIFRCYTTLWNASHKIKPIHIITCSALTESQKLDIKNMLSAYFSEQLIIDFTVDSSILGGILIKTDDMRIDATVLNQIYALNTLLKTS
ncbi:MAG: ATP synthase subunit delta [Holosporales bacterium]